MTPPAKPMHDPLLNCPFCGGQPRLLRSVEAYPAADGQPAGEYDAWFDVACDNCGIRQGDEYRSSAIAAWNRRAAPAVQALGQQAEPVWQSQDTDGRWADCTEANARAAEVYGFKARKLYASPAALGQQEAGSGPNTCKLTECQGKPRCTPCLVMDASYGVEVPRAHD